MDIKLVDTHCHVQFDNYKLPAEEVWRDALRAGVEQVFVVGCDIESSKKAIEFAAGKDGVYAVVGIHPHEAENFLSDSTSFKNLENLLKNTKKDKVVAIGEFGLDYFYEHSAKQRQVELLKLQLDLVSGYNLPAMWHVREAFDDFWPIFDEFAAKKPLRGVLHCFTANSAVLDQALSRGLYVALNGIMTFTKDESQLEMAKNVPLERLLLETDAPYLTPKPFRGTICEPKHVRLTADFLSKLRGEDLATLASQTTRNCQKLFDI